METIKQNKTNLSRISAILASIVIILAAGSLNANADNNDYWTYDKSSFEDYMTITAYVVKGGTELQGTQFEIGCFIDGVCRGNIWLVNQTVGTHSYPCYLPVFGSASDNGKLITLRLYDHTENKIYDIDQKPVYEYTGSLGLSDLYEFSITTAAISVYNITINSNIVNGSVVSDKSNALEGDNVTLTFAAEANYELDAISVDKTGAASTAITLSGSGNSRTFAMPAYDVTVSATFKKTQATLDVDAVAAAKTLIENATFDIAQKDGNDETAVKACLVDSINRILDGTGIAISASDITLSNFNAAIAGTEVSPSGTNGNYNFSVNLTKGQAIDAASNTGSIIATLYVTYNITIAPSTNGTVSSDKAIAQEEATITLSISPDADYELDTISVDKTGATPTPITLSGSGNSRTFTMPAYDVTVSATFKKTQAALDAEVLADAKTLIENATFSTAQKDGNDEVAVKACLVDSINRILDGTGITVSASDITLSNFTAATAGTENDIDGTNGSFDFTVSLTKGLAKDDTASKTGSITATPYVTYNVTIAPSTNGAVSSDEAIAPENATITLTITPDADYELDTISAYKTGTASILVSLSGSGNSRTFTMPAYDVTVSVTFKKTQAAVDAEAIAAAKKEIEDAAAFNITQVEGNTETAVKAWLANQINSLLKGIGISISASDLTLSNFTAATAGTEANPSGTNGTYNFSVNLTKGQTTDTVIKNGNTIMATLYTSPVMYSITIAATTNGTVTSNKGSAQENVTVTLTITPDAGYELEAISAYQTGSASTTVTLSGTGNSRTFTMPAYDITVSATFKKTQATLDAEAIAAAKKEIEDAAAFNITQVEGNTEEAVKAWLTEQINQLLAGTGVSVSANDITLSNFTAATTGTEVNPSGTNGNYSFSVNLAKGQVTDTTVKDGNSIIATLYISPAAYSITILPATNGTVASDKGSAQENETVTLTITPTAGYELEAVSAYQTGSTSTILSLTGNGNSRTVTMPAYDVTVSATFKKTQATLDEEAIATAEKKIEDENTTTFNIIQTEGNTEEAIKAWLTEQINQLLEGTGISVSSNDITISDFNAAIASTEDNPLGVDGSFVFTVILTKGESTEITNLLNGTITATASSGTKVEEISSAVLRASATDNGLSIMGLIPGNTLSIYNIGGQLLISKQVIDTEQFVTLPESGIYILTAGSERIKVFFNALH